MVDIASRGLRAIAHDVGFTEGPVIDGSRVVFVSLDHGFLYAAGFDGAVSVLGNPGRGVNGAAQGPDGSFYVAQSNLSRTPWMRRIRGESGGVQAVRPDGRVDWITRDPVEPNDLCFGPDGMLYVTDPTRFRESRDDGRLWRVDPVHGDAELLCSTNWFPNGLAFGPENDALYVAYSMPEDPRIVRMSLDGPGGIGKPETVFRMTDGYPDGMAFDSDGNIVVAAVRGHPARIQTWSIDGKLLDEFFPGPEELYTNIAIDDAGTMVITNSAVHEVLLCDWPVRGLALHPFRDRRGVTDAPPQGDDRRHTPTAR